MNSAIVLTARRYVLINIAKYFESLLSLFSGMRILIPDVTQNCLNGAENVILHGRKPHHNCGISAFLKVAKKINMFEDTYTLKKMFIIHK